MTPDKGRRWVARLGSVSFKILWFTLIYTILGLPLLGLGIYEKLISNPAQRRRSYRWVSGVLIGRTDATLEEAETLKRILYRTPYPKWTGAMVRRDLATLRQFSIKQQV